ncbi:nibrin isoform X2 [Heptranchias perlo]|uniref:nibrin isoform X2 n=1 Tax=Heptranchias perlo TaxID=212740 RepID=UPI0035599C33
MWVLKPLVSGGEEPYYFLVGVDYVVGRKNCAILLRDDQSISRSHAVLSVSHPAANLTQIAKTSLLTLTDTSKYGTFVNEERLHIHSPRILKSGELVTFGLFQSKFRVEYEPLILCSSCLDGPGKTILNQSVQHLGGHVSNSWTEDNTHLVMSSVKVTVKTICAMICCRPIVKPEFFASLTEAIRNRQHLPSPESFSPPIDEPSIRPGELDITVKPERKSIFRGKTFIFLNEKQHKRLSSALTFGGGNAKLLDNSGSNMSLLETPGSCVVDVGVSDSQPMSYSAEKWIEPVMQTLQRKGLRTIPEAEIGLAVIHNSTDIYCNPHRKPDLETYSSSRTTIPGPTLSQSVDMVDMTAPDFSQVTAYVPDTQPSQEHSTGMNISSMRVVKETPEREEESKIISQDISVVKETSRMKLLFSTNERQKFKNKAEKRQTFTTGDKKPSKATKLKDVKKKDNICSQKQSCSLHNFFQPVGRKREREETGSSQAKFARTEEPNLPFGHQLHITEPILEKRNSEFTSQSTQSECFFENLKTESSAEGSKGSPGGVSEKETTDENVPGKIEFAHEMTTRKKRKDPEDENLKDDMSLSRHEQLGASKRRKIEPEVLSFNVKDESVSEGGTKASTSQVKQESEINQELSAPLKKKSNNNLELLHESENNETLPSKLMLTVFKSLVVSQPGNGGMLVSNAEDSQLKNFKKFRKVVYPGAEEFPKIIGGTDLKAYQTRKSSEMEEWLRQEAEEQSQQAKEETLADDLFSKLMSQNFLQLTIGKTKAILFGPHQKFHVLTLDPIPFRG